jgi:ATPase complex subunit ATP10
MHPDSISATILPGGTHVEHRSIRGAPRKRYTELAYGYFWMLKDLRTCEDKPLLTSPSLIPESRARPFPNLCNLKSLSGETVDVPDYFVRKNRSRDTQAQCTLVAISFRDYGYQLLSSWIDPFREALQDKDRVEVIRLNISEGFFNKWILKGPVQGLMKKNTPVEEHDRTLLYFGSDLALFKDALRMHNVMTGFVFLVDGVGRVRFAGSGKASEDEAARLVRMASELTPLIQSVLVNSKQPRKIGPNRTRQ